MTPFLFLLLALSCWRITHLVVEDTIPIVAKPRDWIINRNPDGNIAYMLGCTYCSSVWVAGLHVAGWYLFVDAGMPVPVAVIGALSILSALGESVLDWLDRFGVSE